MLVNADAVCLAGVTVRVGHASHEYSSVAYGTEARSITMEACHVMGGTGLRIPLPVDSLRILLLNLHGCVVEVRADATSAFDSGASFCVSAHCQYSAWSSCRQRTFYQPAALPVLCANKSVAHVEYTQRRVRKTA